jgi:hypothetical protein
MKIEAVDHDVQFGDAGLHGSGSRHFCVLRTLLKKGGPCRASSMRGSSVFLAVPTARGCGGSINFYEVVSDAAEHRPLVAAVESMRAAGHPVRGRRQAPASVDRRDRRPRQPRILRPATSRRANSSPLWCSAVGISSKTWIGSRQAKMRPRFR